MSTSTKYPVIWDGVVVGEIENVSCDNLNVFGKFYPVESSTTSSFYEQLKNGNELRIKIGNLIEGIIDEPPGTEIELKAIP
jgi:hypothetical protein